MSESLSLRFGVDGFAPAVTAVAEARERPAAVRRIRDGMAALLEWPRIVTVP